MTWANVKTRRIAAGHNLHPLTAIYKFSLLKDGSDADELAEDSINHNVAFVMASAAAIATITSLLLVIDPVNAAVTSNLVVSNKVSGTYASEKYAFPMKLTFYTPSSAPSSATYNVTLPDGTSDLIAVSNHESAGFSFALAHKQELVVSGLPAGTVYKFEQVGMKDTASIEYEPTIKYTVAVAKVSFNANGGTGDMEPLRIWDWTVAPENSFTAPLGKSFAGWNTKADGTGTSYAANSALPIYADMTLYAQWDDLSYSVRFNANGGGGTMSDQAGFIYGTSKALPANAFTAPDGYTFGGWAASESDAVAGTIAYADKANMTTGTTVANGIADLYAVWYRNIDFKSGSNSVATCTVKQYWNGKTSKGMSILSPTAIVCTDISNWTELGWRADTTASTQSVNFNTSFAPSTTTYRAVYSRNVTFYHGYNKSASTSVVQYYNSGNVWKCTTPTAATCTDITYWSELGWRANTTATTATYGFNAACNSSSDEFYAVYSQTPVMSYAGNSNTGGATSSTNGTTRYLNSGNTTLSSANASWTLAANGFTRTGYTFSKWDLGNAGTSYSIATAYNVSPDKTATAQWISNERAYAVFVESTGELIFFRSTESVANGTSTTISDIMGNSYTGIVYTGFDTATYNNYGLVPWNAKRYYIKSAKVATGQLIAPKSTAYWFFNCYALSDVSGLRGLDVASVTDMSYMFQYCYALSDISGLSNWNTAKVTSMSYMFHYCLALSDISGLSNWNTAKVTSMSHMFYFCRALSDTSALSNWSTASVTDMSYMFQNCYALSDISGLSNWNTVKVTSMSYMFQSCLPLSDISDLSNWNTASITDMSYMFYDCRALSDISGLSNWNTAKVTDMSYMFRACYSLADISALSEWNTAKVTSMSYMFQNCSSLAEADLSKWDKSALTNISSMFNGCYALTTIYAASDSATNTAHNWTVQGTTSTAMTGTEVFTNCYNLKGGNSIAYDASNVTYAYARVDTASTPGYFTDVANKGQGSGGTSFVHNPSVPSTSGTAYAAFVEGTGELILFRSTANVANGTSTTISDIMGNSYTGIVYTGVDTVMYGSSGSVPWDAKRNYIKSAKVATGQLIAPKSTAYWFYNCYALSDVSGLRGLDTAKVTNMSNMFNNCCSLSNISGLLNWNIASVTNMSSMFSNCRALSDISGLSNWNTAKVTYMGSMFGFCGSLTDISALSEWNTASVTYMSNMFQGCYALSNISGLSNWNTASVTNMSSMFSNCLALSDISGLSNWNTAKVTNMSYMFHYCCALSNISALSEWNTASVTSMSSMFNSCCGLSNISALSNWSTAKVTNMSYMFDGCHSLAEADLSKWDKSALTNISNMFYSCSALTTIYAASDSATNTAHNWTVQGTTSTAMTGTGVFSGCYNLKGGNGTAFSASNVNVTYAYARVDTASTPGYFTAKAGS